jgi:hypothetical protein
VAGVVYDVLVPCPLPVGLGDEARPQAVRRETLLPRDREAGLRRPAQQDLAHRIGVQPGGLDLAPAADFAEDRAVAAAARLQQRRH